MAVGTAPAGASRTAGSGDPSGPRARPLGDGKAKRGPSRRAVASGRDMSHTPDHRSKALDWLATRQSPSVRYALAGAFAAIAVLVTTGLAASHTFVARIRVAAAEITENSSPTISTLSTLRGVVRKLQVATIEHLDSCDALGCTSG